MAKHLDNSDSELCSSRVNNDPIIIIFTTESSVQHSDKLGSHNRGSNVIQNLSCNFDYGFVFCVGTGRYIC